MAAWDLDDAEWDALDELRFSTSDADVFRNATVILMTGVGRSKFEIAEDLGCSPATVDNVRKRYRERGLEGLQRVPPRRAAASRAPRVSRHWQEAVQTPPQAIGVWLQRLVGQSSGQALGENNEGQAQRRSPANDPGRGRIFVSASQAHHERQTRRGRLCAGPRRVENPQKKALRKNAGEVLIFQDEVEIHLHPALARMWALVGKQPEVPAPGKNEKQVVYGGVDYKTGRLDLHGIADTKCGALLSWQFLARAGGRIPVARSVWCAANIKPCFDVLPSTATAKGPCCEITACNHCEKAA